MSRAIPLKKLKQAIEEIERRLGPNAAVLLNSARGFGEIVDAACVESDGAFELNVAVEWQYPLARILHVVEYVGAAEYLAEHVRPTLHIGMARLNSPATRGICTKFGYMIGPLEIPFNMEKPK